MIAATGEVDLTNAGNLRDAFLSALNAGAAGLVVDLTAVTFIDSACIAALVRAARRASATKTVLRLAATNRSVLRVVDLVGLDQLIRVYPSVAEALDSLPAAETPGLSPGSRRARSRDPTRHADEGCKRSTRRRRPVT